jgi:hypothetical protein
MPVSVLRKQKYFCAMRLTWRFFKTVGVLPVVSLRQHPINGRREFGGAMSASTPEADSASECGGVR